jgi:hypothetical protein
MITTPTPAPATATSATLATPATPEGAVGTSPARPPGRTARRPLGRRALALLVSLAAGFGMLAAGGAPANAATVSTYGARASTISYCNNGHTMQMFNYKNFVYAEYAGQVVAEHTMVLDGAGWHDHGWKSAYGSTVFNTVVGPTTGYSARVYTMYAWYNSAGWHYSGWDESAYTSVYGGALSYCII